MKNNISIIRYYLALLVLFLSSNTTVQAQCNPTTDSLALVALYNNCNGENWLNVSGWLEPGVPLSEWTGVSLNAEGCVDSLMLAQQQLSGNLPTEIGDLKNIKLLDLGNNELISIPSTITQLENLEDLYLYRNNLEGDIPLEFTMLPALKHLTLQGNTYTGNIPPEFGSQSTLEVLNLSFNELEGEIPLELTNLTNLIRLQLSSNNLEGSIPSEISNMSSLEFLYLSYNNLSGPIPASIGELTQMKAIEIKENALSGSLPSSIGNLTEILYLLLNSNELTGEIPSEISGMTTLQRLNLSRNNLSGDIPSSIGDLTNLTTLVLGQNDLSGEIPSTIYNLTDLIYLYLDENNLEGTIAPEIANLSNLTELFLSYNNFEGEILPHLSTILTLRMIMLSDNSFEGTIPNAFSNLLNIHWFVLSNNNFSGTLPTWVNQLIFIEWFDLSHNQFHGCIPMEYEEFSLLVDYIDIFGNIGLPYNGDLQQALANDDLCPATIIGKIQFDENENCLGENGELTLQNRMVKATSPAYENYGYTNENGDYQIYTPNGTYEIELVDLPPYWSENCGGSTTVQVFDGGPVNEVNFLLHKEVDCPLMTVDLATPFLRRCFPNTLVVKYCNEGTQLAENVAVEVVLDEYMIVDSTSIDATNINDNTYTFEVGNIDIGECQTFYLYTTLSCDAELGQTLCNEVSITPDVLCDDPGDWSGAQIEVNGNCENGEVKFIIENTGAQDMVEASTYIIIEDGIILMQEPSEILLNSGEQIEITYPANGSTYICQAMQVDGMPYSLDPIAAVEACGTNEQGEFSTGYVMEFLGTDDYPFTEMDCHEVIGAYDPNDKRGFPLGYGDKNYIERGQDIDYHIRFQNTGTDTAFSVVIADKIAPELDVSSIRFGASSHPYLVDFITSDSIHFTFPNILLVDSTTNEPASHGFVKFAISQQPELPLETVINNEAAIYFDFSDPVITNTTTHTIGEDFVEILVSTQEPLIPNLKVNVSPNPMVDKATITLAGIEYEQAQIKLFNTVGTLLKEDTFTSSDYVFYRNNLQPGIYFFEIIVDGRKGMAGKLVVK